MFSPASENGEGEGTAQGAAWGAAWGAARAAAWSAARSAAWGAVLLHSLPPKTSHGREQGSVSKPWHRPESIASHPSAQHLPKLQQVCADAGWRRHHEPESLRRAERRHNPYTFPFIASCSASQVVLGSRSKHVASRTSHDVAIDPWRLQRAGKLPTGQEDQILHLKSRFQFEGNAKVTIKRTSQQRCTHCVLNVRASGASHSRRH